MGKILWARVVRHQRAVFTILASVYVVANMIVSSRLTFFWDDWDALQVARVQPFAGVFAGHFGHFAPVARALFAGEAKVFGTWYPGYVAVNATMVVLICLLTIRVAQQISWVKTPLVLPVVAVYAASVGVLIHVDTATNAGWILTLLFGMAALLSILRQRPIWIALLLLVLSWGSLASVYLPVATLVAAVLVVNVIHPGVIAVSTRRMAYLILVIALTAPLLSAIANRLANSLNDGMGIPGAGAESAQVLGITSAFTSVVSLMVSWILTPVSILIPSSTSAAVTFSVFIASHIALVLVAALLFVLATAVFVMRSPQRTDGKKLIPTLILWVPVFVMALVISILRPSTMFSLRYMEVWLLPSAIAIAALISCRFESRPVEFLRRTLGCLFIATACVSVIMFPLTLARAANIDRERLGAQLDATRSSEECIRQLRPELQAAIAPSSNAEALCASWIWLREDSMYDRLSYR